ncbi:MAG: hypothetical protein LUG86_00235 [Oscillospiraceae bacterium]|nr:hypothetical protein [Oscillospiraceae bacterium]
MPGPVTVSDEGIKALENMADNLTLLSGRLHQETQTLLDVYEENKSGLGRYSAEILKILEDMGEEEAEASYPVKKLVLKLQRAAIVRKGRQNAFSNSKGRSR